MDEIIKEINKALTDNLSWLNIAFGRAERTVKVVNKKKYFWPSIYKGGNEYEYLTPDSNLGNFSFFRIEDPETVGYVDRGQSRIKLPCSIVFWWDFRRIDNRDNRNIEAIKQQILKALNRKLFLKQPGARFEITRIWKEAENIYKGYTLDETQNQFLMHPYCGLRIEGILTYNETC